MAGSYRALLYGSRVLGVACQSCFVYPFIWMITSSFRTQDAILSAPLRLWPESFNLTAFRDDCLDRRRRLSGFAWNSILITVLSTALGVCVTGLGAYALYRNPRLPLFTSVRYGFLLTIMYPHMLAGHPALLRQLQAEFAGNDAWHHSRDEHRSARFFHLRPVFPVDPGGDDRSGEDRRRVGVADLLLVIVPIARPVITTAVLIAFLMNWKQWFPVMVLSTSPDTYTLPVALISLNSEYGINFQATMALSTITVIPVVVLFFVTQRRVMDSFMAGGVKG